MPRNLCAGTGRCCLPLPDVSFSLASEAKICAQELASVASRGLPRSPVLSRRFSLFSACICGPLFLQQSVFMGHHYCHSPTLFVLARPHHVCVYINKNNIYIYMKERLWWDEGCLGVRYPPPACLDDQRGGAVITPPPQHTFDHRWGGEGGPG